MVIGFFGDIKCEADKLMGLPRSMIVMVIVYSFLELTA